MTLTLSNIRPLALLPPLHGDPCQSSLYAPCYVPSLGLFAQGGHIDGGFDLVWGSEKRQADRIWFQPPAGTPIQLFDNKIFDWMGNPEMWLWRHPESYIGSCNSPSVIALGSGPTLRYVMAFAASISDPNVACGEHTPPTNPYGSQTLPWSFFALYLAVSPTGLPGTWSLVRSPRGVLFDGEDPMRWAALNASALYSFPRSMDMDPDPIGGFKGVGDLCLVDGRDGYLYLFIELWTADPRCYVKEMAIRAPLDLAQPVGHSFDWEIFDPMIQPSPWDQLLDRRLPDWVLTGGWRGVVFDKGAVRVASSAAGWLALCAPSGQMWSKTTASLPAGWTEGEAVTGAPTGVMYPQPYEDASGLHVAFTMHARACPQADPFYGLSIYLADLQ